MFTNHEKEYQIHVLSCFSLLKLLCHIICFYIYLSFKAITDWILKKLSDILEYPYSSSLFSHVLPQNKRANFCCLSEDTKRKEQVCCMKQTLPLQVRSFCIVDFYILTHLDATGSFKCSTLEESRTG